MLILENLRYEVCELWVDVGDTADEGVEGTLTFEIADLPSKSKTVKLFFPARKEGIPPTPKTGKTHMVIAKLTVGAKTKSVGPLIFKFCS